MGLRQGAFRKIDRKIYVVFLMVIAIALINAVISTYTIKQSQNITSDIVNNTNPSLDALAKMNLLVTRSRMLITNWVYLPNNTSDKDSLRNLNNNDYTQLKIKLSGLMSNWENKDHIKKVNELFVKYEYLMSQQSKIMRQLNTFEDYQDPVKKFAAEDILEREIIPHSEDLTAELKVILQQKTQTALAKQDDMLYQFNFLVILVLGLALLIIGSILFAGFVITRSIILPILQVRGIIMQMGRGELPELKMKVPRNAVGEMMQALGFLIDGFRQTSRFVEEIGKGNFNFPFKPLSSKDVQGHALLTMRNQLQAASDEEASRQWQNEGLVKLNQIMRSTNDDFNLLLDKIIESIVDHIEVEQAAIFLLHNDDLNDLHIQLGAYHALNNKILNSRRYELKEGLIGQAIASNKIISVEQIYDPYFTIDTGIGESKSCNIMIIPLVTSGKVVGAIEVATLRSFTPVQKDLLEKMAEPIAANLFSVRANLITTQLLEESRKQADELAYQEQELRKINNELTKQSELLQQSEEELKAQQEELKQVNLELQEKAGQLEEQNLAIEDARQSLVFKAEQLEQSNKYKSAFLANMSHELRTPLNSILILAKLLADNKNHNLDNKQTEHAKIIYKSGNDLLTLINDILDLSKIEAGKVDLQYEELNLNIVTEDIHLLFRELAYEKQINFEVKNELSASTTLSGDKVRIEQVIKNMLSNAFKFTPAGGQVTFKISTASPEITFKEKALLQADQVIAISVKDSGIGIAEDKQKLVFEAFQQADGSTSRKFGGTGLGLAICKELTHMMGGELLLESVEGAGSTFTMYLPQQTPGSSNAIFELNKEQISNGEQLKEVLKMYDYANDEIKDDRQNIVQNDKIILIIEDDYVFAKMLMNHCHRFGFKAIIALQGDQGLNYAKKYLPYAVILDMRLPVMDGWTVLKHLKENRELNRIPVHIISSVDKKQLGLDMGAVNYLNKPAGVSEMESMFNSIASVTEANLPRMLLFGEENEETRKVVQLLHEKEKQLQIDYAKNLEDCIDSVKNSKIECLMIGSNQDVTITQKMVQLIQSNNDLKDIPLVFCSGNPDECLREVSNLIHDDHSAKHGDVLDEAGLFLNTVSKGLHNFEDTQIKMSDILHGKTVLVVDDDVRNIYSMTNILESEGLQIITAFDGIDALNKLKQNNHIDIVLMDIMMPNMNGYEAIQEIRKNHNWNDLPVIAVTAKAMNGDREKCMEAGATDYMTKPIQAEQLISLMKVWLYK
jgi:signal transduction histidine kinase/CheY-like chemotaxis protein